MKPNLLITGASGFIGSILLEEALLQGYSVFAAVRQSSKLNIHGHPDVHVIYLDYNNLNALTEQLILLKKKFGRFNYVIHNAGVTRANTIDDFDKINNLLPQRFVQALNLSNNIPDKFLLISSMAAFGPGDTKTMSPVTVNQTMNPISYYGKSKKAVSEYFLNHSIIPFTIVYPTAVYGPGDKDFIELVKLINKGTEPYLGLYKQILSMVHVKDLAFAVVSLLTKAPDNSQYIISDNKNYNKKELGSIIKQVLQKKTLRFSIPVTPILWIAAIVEALYRIFAPEKMPLLTREKIKEISCANWSCDADDVWKTIGTNPQYDLQSGMKQTINWYKENGML